MQSTINPTTAIPQRLASDIDPLHFDNAYLAGVLAWQTDGKWAHITAPFKDEPWSIGVWKGYCDARYQIPRSFAFACIEAYNEVVLVRDHGQIEELIESRIGLTEFTHGYLEGMRRGKRKPQKEAQDNQCAFDMGLLKAGMDIYRNCDRSEYIVVAYNEVERECRRLGHDHYGWNSRTAVSSDIAEALGLTVFEATAEAAAWNWVWANETTGSSTWRTVGGGA